MTSSTSTSTIQTNSNNNRMRDPDPLLRVAVLVYALLFESVPLEAYTDTAAVCADPGPQVFSSSLFSISGA